MLSSLLLVFVLFIGYFGFMPGVSALMGTNKPRDLKISYSSADLSSAQSKLQQSIIDALSDPYGQLVDSDSATLVVELTPEELSAILSAIQPISDVQVKIIGETVEFSGQIDSERIPQFLSTVGVSGFDEENALLELTNIQIPFDPVFYVKGTGSVRDDNVDLELERVELGRLPIPVDKADKTLKTYIEAVLDSTPNLDIGDAGIKDGKLLFKGTVPTQIPEF